MEPKISKIRVNTPEELADFAYSLSLGGEIKIYAGKLNTCRCGCKGIWARWKDAEEYERKVFNRIMEEIAIRLPMNCTVKDFEKVKVCEFELDNEFGYVINQYKYERENSF